MIQFNLLPDIKLEYIKAQHAKRSVVLISVIAAGSALGLFVLLFLTVNVFQKQHISNLTNDIQSAKTELAKIEDLDKVLTIQNQLNSITGLHDQKPVVTRFYSFLPQLVPATAGSQFTNLISVEVDLTESTVTFAGTADSLATVNKFVDTLKFTTFDTVSSEKSSAFSNVVLSAFGTGDGLATYEIDLKFDPLIFSGAEEVKLTVPQIISTRSSTEKPSESLFRQQIQQDAGVPQ